MPTVSVIKIAKSFGATQAVTEVSFEIEAGEIFGLLGPNGAGKTTTIRILLDIFKPDRGQVMVLGGAMTEAKKAHIGYMPEERGLYQDIPLDRCLLYLASLKRMPDNLARSRLDEYLEQFDLATHRKKKVKELSKGMQQKAQIINTLLHNPELVIIDEPFTSLDPVNVQMVKDVLQEKRDQGATILMSTHQMRQVEELCDRIVLINGGRDVLYGEVGEIRRRFSGHAVTVQIEGEMPVLEGIVDKEIENKSINQHATYRLNLMADTTPLQIMKQLAAHEVNVEKFEIAVPSLDEIFIKVVEEGEE